MLRTTRRGVLTAAMTAPAIAMTAPAILHRPARAEACIAQIWALEEAPNLRPLMCLLAADA